MSVVNGLPAHILLVHLIVVLVPLTALLAVLSAVWPAARRRFAWLVLALAALVAVMTPVTTEAGSGSSAGSREPRICTTTLGSATPSSSSPSRC